MESQELVTQNAVTGPPAPYVDDTGLGSVTKISPTRIKLVQPMTVDPQGARVGQLLDEGTGLAYDELKMVPFKFRYSRVFFPPGASVSKGVEPLCRSNNGVVPVDDARVKQASKCENCPRAQWHGKTPPDCKEKLDILAIDMNTDLPHFVSAGGMSFTPVRKKLNGLSSMINQDRKAGKDTQPFHFALTFVTERAGQNYRMVIKSIEKLKDDAKAFYTEMYNAFRSAADAKQEFAEGEAVADNAVGEVLEGEIVQEV